jgi:Tol biopolymer transport system component
VADHFASQIYVVNADGTHVQVLTNFTQDTWNGVPTWSPDGSRIAFQSYKHGATTMTADGTDFRVIGAKGAVVWNPVP